MTFDIETFRLPSGTYVCRPTGSLGNVGSYPCLWVAGYGNSEREAIQNFYDVNPHIR